MTRIIAHRGFAHDAAENTLAAFHAATPPADMVEFDVQASADGVPVVVHDSNLERLTGQDASVEDLTADELGELDILGSDEGIPTLAECLNELEAPLLVELKTPRALRDTEELLAQYDGEVLVQSFDPHIVELVDDSFRTGLLCPPRDALGKAGITKHAMTSIDSAVEFMEEVGGCAINPHHSLCDSDAVEKLHDHGFQVNCWTIRDEEVACRVAAAGVDGVITDSADYTRFLDSET